MDAMRVLFAFPRCCRFGGNQPPVENLGMSSRFAKSIREGPRQRRSCAWRNVSRKLIDVVAGQAKCARIHPLRWHLVILWHNAACRKFNFLRGNCVVGRNLERRQVRLDSGVIHDSPRHARSPDQNALDGAVPSDSFDTCDLSGCTRSAGGLQYRRAIAAEQ